MAGLESYKRLDIRYLHKTDGLRPGVSYSSRWTRGDKPAGDIGIKTESGYILLIYGYRRGDDEWRHVEERVYLDWTPCNYGGRRPWFLCPGCGRRVGILAAAGKYFLCRHCYGLKYSSQLESDLDRAQRKVQKIKDRMGEKTWTKPKRMHQNTFDRLKRRLIEAEMKADEIFCIMAAKIMMRHP
jgi:hypothetical protein